MIILVSMNLNGFLGREIMDFVCFDDGTDHGFCVF